MGQPQGGLWGSRGSYLGTRGAPRTRPPTPAAAAPATGPRGWGGPGRDTQIHTPVGRCGAEPWGSFPPTAPLRHPLDPPPPPAPPPASAPGSGRGRSRGGRGLLETKVKGHQGARVLRGGDGGVPGSHRGTGGTPWRRRAEAASARAEAAPGRRGAPCRRGGRTQPHTRVQGGGGRSPVWGVPAPRGGSTAPGGRSRPPPQPPPTHRGAGIAASCPQILHGGGGVVLQAGGGPGGGSRGPVGGWGGSSPPHIGPQASLPGPSGRLGAGGRPPAPPAPPPHAPPGGAGHGGGVSRPKVGDAGSAPPRAAQPLPVPLEAGGDGGPGPLPSGSQPPPAIPAPPQQQAEAHVGGGDVKSRGGRLRGISRPPRQEVGGRAAVLRRRVLKMGPAGGAEMGGAGAVERETSLEP